MNDRQRSNLVAEAFADQVRSSIRDDVEIPVGPICAAAARTITNVRTGSPAFDEAANRLLESWAKEYGVDRPSSGD